METKKQFTIISDDIEIFSSLDQEGFKIISIHADNLEEEPIKVVIEINSLEDLYILNNGIILNEEFISKKELHDLSVEWISEEYDVDKKGSELIYDVIKSSKNIDYDIDCTAELLASFYKKILNYKC